MQVAVLEKADYRHQGDKSLLEDRNQTIFAFAPDFFQKIVVLNKD